MMKYRVVLALFSSCLALPVSSQVTFPGTFEGTWKGVMNWYSNSKAEPQEIPMELHVLPLEDSAAKYSWQLIYGEARTDQRPYTLKPADPNRGHWVIDENNGILLDHYWLGNVLSGVFSINSSTVLSSFRLEQDHIVVEFFGYKTPAERTSGGASPDVPRVESFRIGSFQRAVLKKN